MPKKFVGLCLATLIAGVSGFAPYAAGQCALRGGAMPGMASDAGMAMDGAGAALEARFGPGATSGRAPTGAHHHGCCGCLGPCTGSGLAALPSPATCQLAAPRVALRQAPAVPHMPELLRVRILPFANGPPSLVG